MQSRSGRWQRDEQYRFLKAMRSIDGWAQMATPTGPGTFPWAEIAETVMTRNATQCRTHAQKTWTMEGYRVYRNKADGGRGYDLVTPTMSMTSNGIDGVGQIESISGSEASPVVPVGAALLAFDTKTGDPAADDDVMTPVTGHDLRVYALNSKAFFLDDIKGLSSAPLATWLNTNASSEEATSFFNMGVTKSHAGDLDGAMKAFKKTITLSKTHVHARMNIAKLIQQQGDLHAAIDMVSEATAVARFNLGMAHYQLGCSRAAEGQHSVAAEAFKDALAIHPTNPATQFSLGTELMELEDFESAVAAFNSVLVAQPENDEARGRLCHALQELQSGDTMMDI